MKSGVVSFDFYFNFFQVMTPFNPIVPNAPFLYSLKTSENFTVSDVFRGCAFLFMEAIPSRGILYLV